MHLIVQYYLANHSSRQAELDFCLIQNLSNPHFEYVHVLCETRDAMKHTKLLEVEHDKLKLSVVDKRLTYHEAFQYCNEYCHGKICILTNSDIYYDETLAKLNEITVKNQFICLSRYEHSESGRLEIFHLHDGDSQDSWIFRSPIEIHDCQFPMGKPGCDNRIAFLAKKSGYDVFNPAMDIKSYHVHDSRHKTYSQSDRLLGLYLFLPPCQLHVHNVTDYQILFNRTRV